MRPSLLLAIPLALCLMGADSPQPNTRSRDIGDFHLTLTEMGGCQYVMAYRYGTGVSIVHHAACTNPAHLLSRSDSVSPGTK